MRLTEIQGKDNIFVVVDRINKYAHLFVVKNTISTSEVLEIFIKEVFKLHGMQNSIISDRDRKFTANVLKELFKLVGKILNMSTSYHPKIDGQTERVNQWLEGYMRNYVDGKTIHGQLGFTWVNSIIILLSIFPLECLHSNILIVIMHLILMM